MKTPKRPQEPRAPYKPVKPNKIVPANTLIGSRTISTYSKYSVEDLFGNSLENVFIEFEIDKTWDYDDYTYEIIATTYSTKEIEDPDYDKKYSDYLKLEEKYEKDYQEFKKKKKKYKADMKEYKIELDKAVLEQQKRNVLYLEEKLSKLKNG